MAKKGREKKKKLRKRGKKEKVKRRSRWVKKEEMVNKKDYFVVDIFGSFSNWVCEGFPVLRTLYNPEC